YDPSPTAIHVLSQRARSRISSSRRNRTYWRERIRNIRSELSFRAKSRNPSVRQTIIAMSRVSVSLKIVRELVARLIQLDVICAGHGHHNDATVFGLLDRTPELRSFRP